MPTSESKQSPHQSQSRVQQHRRKGTAICHVGHYPTSRLSGWDLFYPSLTQKTIAGEGYPSQVARWALQKQFLQLTIDGPVSGRLRLVGALGPQDQSVQGALGPHLVFCCELSFLILPQKCIVAGLRQHHVNFDTACCQHTFFFCNATSWVHSLQCFHSHEDEKHMDFQWLMPMSVHCCSSFLSPMSCSFIHLKLQFFFAFTFFLPSISHGGHRRDRS